MNSLSDVCVVGDSGLLGQALLKVLPEEGSMHLWGVSSSPFIWRHRKNRTVCRYTHEVLDLLKQQKAFLARLRRFKPALLINCAALTDLVECEKNSSKAKKLNAFLPAWLAKICAGEGIVMIHVSTDQIFNGKKKTPYTENDIPSPVHVYGASKLLGEEEVLKANPGTLVARTNIVGFRGRAHKPTYVEWLSTALLNQEPITLADDFVTSSIQATAFARLLVLGYRKGLKGIFNIASKDVCSKYQFGRLLAAQLEFSFSNVTKGILRDLHLFPARPAYSGLEVGRAEKALDLSFPRTMDTIKALAKDFRSARREVLYA